MRKLAVTLVSFAACVAVGPISSANKLSARQIVVKVLEHDFWGLSGAEVSATAVLKDKKGKKRTLSFSAKSRKYKGYLAKSLIRFRRPPDLAGAGFLQVQNDVRDDDRFLYLPALKRSRRVAAGQRRTSFMGTDFSFADMDRRDLRSGAASGGGSVAFGKYPCYRVTIAPKRKDSPYSKLVLLVRKDNFVPLQIKSYDKSGVHYKTLSVFQIKKVGGKWFITKSRMIDHKQNHQTSLIFTKLKPRDDIPFSEFTKQKLER